MSARRPTLADRVLSVGPLARLHAAWRARQQERLASRSVTHYRRVASERQIDVPEGDRLRQAVAVRLAGTGRRVSAKPKGSLHLFLPYPVQNWERILPRSLEPFGRVTSFEWRSQGFDDRVAPAQWLAVRDEMNRRMVRAFDEARAIQPVDVVCAYVSGYTVSPETLRHFAAAGAVVLNFCYDDKLTFPGEHIGGRYTSPAALANSVDLNLTNAPESLVKYAAHGGLAMFWPEAAHPDVHRPYDVPFEFEVSFAGRRFGWRPQFVDDLARHGVRVECFGPGWPNGPLSDDELVRLYSRSRINLGSGGIGHSRRLQCLKGRDFEVPMSGGLYLTSHNLELSLCFELGKEILTYRDPADCSATIRRLLDDPDQAAAVRAAGRRRALADHTYEARWSDAFRMVGLLD